MSGKRIGYIRVSSEDQNPDRQLEGIAVDHKFIDYASAKGVQRPSLEKMLAYIRDGDHVIVHSIDRLARNLRDLQSLVDLILSKKSTVHFVKEGLLFDGLNTSSMSQFMMQIMGSFAEFERSLIRERQREGIELAKKMGKYSGRAAAFSPSQLVEVRDMHKLGVSKAKISRHFKVSRFTVYKYLKVKND